MDGIQEFGELKAKVEMVVHGQEQLRQEMQAGFLRLENNLTVRLNKYSDRLSRLERWRAYVMGGIGFAIFLYSTLLAWFQIGQRR